MVQRRARGWIAAVFALSGIAGACTDSPSSVVTSAAVLESVVSEVQTAVVGGTVEAAPAVVVRDGRGDPLSGVLVGFSVTRGGGTVAVSSTRTDAEGMASAGAWTLGNEGVNEVTATAANLEPVRFTATATSPAPVAIASEYHIDVRYIGGTPTSRQREAVTAAVARWRSVIVDDLPAVPLQADADACFDGQPAMDAVIDDIMIYVEFVEIDGRGKILGQAGPCYVRSGSQLPVLGHLKLDAADLAVMETAGTLDDVVLHEIGHVLGIGTLWDMRKLLTGAGGTDPVFHGEHALGAYLEMGVSGAAGVPVENTGGEGTRDGHWRESVFGSELMTGYIGSRPNPLSALTVASLTDLGYGTSAAGASGYALGLGSQNLIREPIDLRGRETMLRPRFEVDRDGRTREMTERRPVGPVR